jgi:glutamate carboxypeptidase
MKISFNLDQFLKDLEYLVNIDSQSKDTEGVAEVASFFEKAFAGIGWKVERRISAPRWVPVSK